MLFFKFNLYPFEIDFALCIPSPFKAKDQVFHKHKFGRLSENKSWEAEASLMPFRTFLEVSLSFAPTGCDHAGLRTYVEVLGLYGELNIYDGRHWNYLENRWYEPGEQEKEGEEQKAFEEWQVLRKEALPLLRQIRDSFLHTEDGPNYTEYTAVDSEADMHFFDEICQFINKYRDLEEEFAPPLKVTSPPVPPPIVPPPAV